MKAKTLAGGGLVLGLLVAGMVPATAQAVEDRAGCSATAVPLCANAAQQTLRVTLADDSEDEGSLRWAFEQAEHDGGITEILVAEGLVIESSGDIPFVGGVRLIGEGEKGATIRAINEDASALLTSEWRGDNLEFSDPVHIENMTFEALEPEMAGVQLSQGVSTVGVYDSEFVGFRTSGLTVVPADDALTNIEVIGSRFANTREGGEAGLYLVNEDSETNVLVRGSTFEDNAGTGLAIDSTIAGTPGKHATATVENSQFLRNGSGDDATAGMSVFGVRLDEEQPGEQLSEPFVTVRDSLFDGNHGQEAGGLRLPDINVEVSGSLTGTLVDVTGNTFVNNTNDSGVGGSEMTLPTVFSYDLEAASGQPTPLCSDLASVAVRNSTFSNSTGTQPELSRLCRSVMLNVDRLSSCTTPL
ncbi:hypothetical protein [Leucobacter sp. 1207-22]|uniref:hypothetical protein n=1 Tax=Leucobacter sp. 1207-22 TaxID=2604456 RepID=UPI0040642F89